MRNTNVYVVPDLAIKDIIDYFSEFNITIKAPDITKCNSSTVVRIYDSILELYLGRSTEDIIMKKNRNEECIYNLVLCKRMNYFLHKLGIDTFSFKDIAFPESKRFIGFLSAIINFSIYRDGKQSVYESMVHRSVEREAMNKRLDDEIKAKEKILQERRKSNNKRMEEIENIRMENENRESKLREKYKELRKKEREYERIKNSRVEIEDKLSSSQLINVNIKSDITKLKAQIVSDPEKLVALLEEMRIFVMKEKEEIKTIKEEIRKYNEDKIALQKERKELREKLKLAYEYAEEARKDEELHCEISKLDSLIKAQESHENSVKKSIETITRQISHLETKFHRLKENDDAIKDEIITHLSNLKIEYDNKSTEREKLTREVEENMKNIREIEFEKLKLKNEYDTHILNVRKMLNKTKEMLYKKYNDFYIPMDNE